MKEGSRIVAKVSKGVEMVTVPELAAGNKDTAREKLRALNLTLLIKTEETTDVPVDCVVRTDPAAGSVVKAGTTVTLYIRRDSTEVSYVTVPACIGSTSEQQASLRLTQRGLAMRVITVEDASPAGTVIAQSPNAGAMVMRGTVVTVTVSSGPPPVVAPPPAPPESESDSRNRRVPAAAAVIRFRKRRRPVQRAVLQLRDIGIQLNGAAAFRLGAAACDFRLNGAAGTVRRDTAVTARGAADV
ncbi:MAG: PASTA domain-containing protein [Ruthenibacterium lactatiformans]